MAISYEKKTWVDRQAENLGGRLLTDDNTGDTMEVTVELNEGTVTVEGTPLNAETFNDLEDRIDTAFSSIPESTNVTVTPVITTGTTIATITVDGTAVDIKETDYSNALILDVTSVGV